MKREKKIENAPQIKEISGNPQTVPEIINKYGTYEIQPTADTENTFPAISQGKPGEKKGNERSRRA